MKKYLILSAIALFTSISHADCLTHEKNQDILFVTENIVQEHIQTADIDSQTMQVLTGFDKILWDMVLAESNAIANLGADVTAEKALREYYTDIAVNWIKIVQAPKLVYLRFELSLVTGNKVYLVFEQSLKGNASYRLMSKTVDGAELVCDSSLLVP